MNSMQVWIKRGLAAMIVMIAAALLFVYREPILEFVTDQERVRAWLEGLGPFGPLGLIVLNAGQIVFPFIPGYLMQAVSGYLFGWALGAIYGVIGMMLGGILAMVLARVFGRPLVRRLVGDQRLVRWEAATHLNSLPIWFILMLGPFGDVPYFIAGLTSLAIWKIIAIALLVRGPSVLAASAVGAGVISLTSPWIIGGAALLLSLAVVGMRFQDRIERWVDATLLARVLKRQARGHPPVEHPSPLLAEPSGDHEPLMGEAVRVESSASAP